MTTKTPYNKQKATNTTKQNITHKTTKHHKTNET